MFDRPHLKSIQRITGMTLYKHAKDLVSVLGREEGYTVKHTPPSEGVPEGAARGNS